MLKLVGLSKAYGKKVVLEDVNLTFDDPQGVYGLLGRNGVGKTTMMQIIFQMLPNYQGEILFHGQFINEYPEALGEIICVGGEIYSQSSIYTNKLKKTFNLFDALYENFDLDYGMKLLEIFNLNPKEKFKKLSTGNRTLVQNIIGLASRTPITILDEPTNGLDSVNREKFFRLMMEDYAEFPRMFILSTHLINEVENYLTDVIILKDAKVLVESSLADLQDMAYRIEGYPIDHKNVIRKDYLGDYSQIDIYDSLSSEEINQITSQGGRVKPLDLQSLFNGLVEG